MKLTQSDLSALQLPPVVKDDISWDVRRTELVRMIHEEYMGDLPDKKSLTVSYEITDDYPHWYGDKATRSILHVNVAHGAASHSFPVQVILPKKDHIPVFLHLAFENLDPFCGEEIIDHGYGMVKVCYTDIEPDDQKDNHTGFAALMDKDAPHRWGKFGCWAFAASLILDGLSGYPQIDPARVAVVGHSRLAMTALYAGLTEPRFSLIGAINSGALHRGTSAETFEDLSREYTKYWFTGSLFEKYHSETELPFDNHFLTALCAPRHVYLSAASLDEWCDPKAMAYGGLAASPAYEALGKKGLILPETVEENVLYDAGDISYYDRTGTHYFGRDDLLNMIKIRDERGI
ncbi:MAG: hypothetical protein K5682_11975 [Lachnospiraceae bacterium]|nr:hypothetical protein [Lachnospiraceae bacterium]